VELHELDPKGIRRRDRDESGDEDETARLRTVADDSDYEPPERRMRTTKFPLRTGLTAIFLLFVGVLFGSIGLWKFLTQGLSAAVPFLTIGGIGFIPGSYHVVFLFYAWMRYPGYSYDLIPTYEDT